MDTDNYEEQFEKAVADWRAQHRLREDDAVLLLIQLFRIHQEHWDRLRRKDLPSFEQFRTDINRLSESSKAVLNAGTAFTATVKSLQSRSEFPTVPRSTALLAAILAAITGYLIAKAYP